MKEVYAKSIRQLEERVDLVTKELDEERKRSSVLSEKVLMRGVPKPIEDDEFEPLEIEDEIARMRHLKDQVDNMNHKVNDGDHQLIRKSG
jgi:hypothetical protein